MTVDVHNPDQTESKPLNTELETLAPEATAEQAELSTEPTSTMQEPDAEAAAAYEELYRAWRKLYFALGCKTAEPAAIGDILPLLRRTAREAHNRNNASTTVA